MCEVGVTDRPQKKAYYVGSLQLPLHRRPVRDVGDQSMLCGNGVFLDVGLRHCHVRFFFFFFCAQTQISHSFRSLSQAGSGHRGIKLAISEHDTVGQSHGS